MEKEISFLFKGSEIFKNKVKRISPIVMNNFFEIVIECNDSKLFIFDYDDKIDFEFDWNYLIYKLFDSEIMIDIGRNKWK